MGQPSSKDEMTIRHQFDRLCQMALKGEAVNYYKHMDYRRKHEVTFSELSEKELSKLFTMDEYGTEYHHFEVHGYDIEVKNTLIAEALKELTERKRNVILLSPKNFAEALEEMNFMFILDYIILFQLSSYTSILQSLFSQGSGAYTRFTCLLRKAPHHEKELLAIIKSLQCVIRNMSQQLFLPVLPDTNSTSWPAIRGVRFS